MPRQQPSSPKKKRKQLDFEDWYEIAKKYYEEHGDLLVPRIYEDEEGHKLGRWIERLRAVYNGNPKIKVALTQTGIVMLEKIGMVWKLESRYPWPEWYLQCRLYYAANGDLRVPKMYKNEQYALGNWIGEQRKKYKKGTLKPEQVEALEKVGMVWELVDRDVWEKRYNDAYAYYNEHGNIDVSPNVLTAGNMYLRDWLIAQKSLYQESNCETDLDWERHDLLDDIGMDWEKQVGRKSYSYAYRAQRYYNEFGNLDVPEDYNDMMGGNLHKWVKRQWRLYHRPTTDKSDAYISKKKELENLGFDWSCEGRWDWDAKEATWLQNYNGIKAYVDVNGSLPIGESSIPLTTSVNSEFWIAAQKAAIRNGMMNEDKQQMLASIGVVYGQFKRSDDWQENYNFVKAYYEQHKQLPVYGDGMQIRDWLYVMDHCKAIDMVANGGKDGEVYNVGGHNERPNIFIVKTVIAQLHDRLKDEGISEELIKHVADRLGHDRRYGIDPTKIKNDLGWYPETPFEKGIVLTIDWYLNHQEWMDHVTSGDYQNYYQDMYKNK